MKHERMQACNIIKLVLLDIVKRAKNYINESVFFTYILNFRQVLNLYNTFDALVIPKHSLIFMYFRDNKVYQFI